MPKTLMWDVETYSQERAVIEALDRKQVHNTLLSDSTGAHSKFIKKTVNPPLG